MATTDCNKSMFIGLPSSGKSTFIGALWHVVLSGEINSSYSITSQPSDREYLNKLQTNFLECTPPERTKLEVEKKIELQMKDSTTGEVVEFIFPDLSGETYESQFEYRKLTLSYFEQIKQCNNIILFVNPDSLKKANLISEANAMLDDVATEEHEVESNVDDKVKWEAKMCQTQIILVDLLQMIGDHLKKPCKIGIIISAWDLIKNMPDPMESILTPREWMQKHLPLLNQYMVSNEKTFKIEVFGLSAQGGQYKKDDNADLHSFINPSERILVQFENEITSDITVPLKWLFSS